MQYLVILWNILCHLACRTQPLPLGLDYAYIALPVRPDDLSLAVSFLRAANFRGCNVTIPHKSAIMPLLSEVMEDAQRIGAVNTVVNEDGRLIGYNTDCIGFLKGLEIAGFNGQGKRAVLLGAGGGARAVLWGLIKSGAKSVTIGARNVEKARALAKEFAKYTDIHLAAFSWDSAEFDEEVKRTELLVNATPLGMTPNVEASPKAKLDLLPQNALVMDIIYTPRETKFLHDARELGHNTKNGEDMLVYQGIAAFELWTGKRPDAKVMKSALRGALGI